MVVVLAVVTVLALVFDDQAAASSAPSADAAIGWGAAYLLAALTGDRRTVPAT